LSSVDRVGVGQPVGLNDGLDGGAIARGNGGQRFATTNRVDLALGVRGLGDRAKSQDGDDCDHGQFSSKSNHDHVSFLLHMLMQT
jgi:hypothetical protein